MDVPLPLLCSPPVVALAATFLGWILYHPEDATFNWDILRLSDQNKEELRATVDFMVKVIADSDPIDEDYASFLPEAKYALSSPSVLCLITHCPLDHKTITNSRRSDAVM